MQPNQPQMSRSAQQSARPDSKWYFWRRRGWLRYPLLVMLLAGTAVALRGGLWSQTPAKAAKRAAKRSLRSKAKPLPKVLMFLEHNERDINLEIKRGKHVLPRPVITRGDRRVTVELSGVQVRPRKWTLSGSRVSSINVKVDKKGSKLVIAQDPKVKGTLKDAFSAEDINGNLVLRVLNQSIGDKHAHPTSPAQHDARTKIVNASAGPLPTTKAKHPLGQKLNHQAPPAVKVRPKSQLPRPVNAQHRASNHHKVQGQANAAPHQPSPPLENTQENTDGRHAHPPAPVQVVEHPVAQPQQPPKDTSGQDPHQQTIAKSALSLAASVLAFGLLALIPILWWKKKQTGPAADIKVQERLALSPKHSLVRVKLGANDLWLGLSEGNIQVITPASSRPAKAHTSYSTVPKPGLDRDAQEDLFEPAPPEALPEPMPAAPPPTLARRKLAAFKMRLREALAHPDSEPCMDLAQDAGRQANAIRQELARRQAHAMAPQESEFEQDAA